LSCKENAGESKVGEKEVLLQKGLPNARRDVHTMQGENKIKIMKWLTISTIADEHIDESLAR
jgi:hypothetical protein